MHKDNNNSTPKYILAIDQGTTSTRAVLLDESLSFVGEAQQEFKQYFPKNGWVEHDADEIWKTVLDTCNTVLLSSKVDICSVSGIGISNQRETIVAWDRRSGHPIYHAIVWQDRRTSQFCETLKEQQLEALIQQKTGLVIDPYFSSSKIKWILENVNEAKQLLEQGALCVGTIDSYLIYKFSLGQVHVTDVTNASRTQLFNINDLCWDDELLDLFKIPRSILPEVKSCNSLFAMTHSEIFGHAIPICGVAGDQQAALIGQACFEKGDIKNTFGTGCFSLLNIGDTPVISKNRLLTTVAFKIDDRVCYALEGSIFIAGAAIQWLRDGLKLIEVSSEVERYAEQADPEQVLYLVPAFTGLGAPYWNAQARGAVFGLTRSSGIKEMCKATLESVAYQANDLLQTMKQDIVDEGLDIDLSVIKVDGGMTHNTWFLQFLSDMLGVKVKVAQCKEATVLGAAYLAANALKIYPSPEDFREQWQASDVYVDKKNNAWRRARQSGWESAVTSTLNFDDGQATK